MPVYSVYVLFEDGVGWAPPIDSATDPGPITEEGHIDKTGE
jgi:hypothetical protein